MGTVTPGVLNYSFSTLIYTNGFPSVMKDTAVLLLLQIKLQLSRTLVKTNVFNSSFILFFFFFQKYRITRLKLINNLRQNDLNDSRILK